MPSYAHKRIVEQISRLDVPPVDDTAFSSWIKAGAHLDLLRANATQDEIIVYASGPYTFIHSMVVPNNYLSPPNEVDLLSWNCNPYISIAGYVSGGGRDGTWVERGTLSPGSETLAKGINLIFGRTFEGWSGDEKNYFEVNQEYSHLSGIHWRPEERAYCRFDERGDLEHVVSVSTRSQDKDIALVSFSRANLEYYLAASNSSLVRMFDFTLLRYEDFPGWPAGPEDYFSSSSADFFSRGKLLDGKAALYERRANYS